MHTANQLDPYLLRHKTIIVTGGGSGIGLAAVRALLDQAARVVAVDLDVDRVKGLSGDIQVVRGDATEPETVREAISRAVESPGAGIDGVLFAAGRSAVGKLAAIDRQQFEQDIFRNLTVHLPLTQAILAYKQQGGAAGRQCSLVYVASKQAVAPSSGFGGYPIAKGAVLQMARLAAIEGGRYGVRANIVNPGAVFDGSQFWSDTLAEEKARHHGVPVDQLPDYYADRTLLGVRVLAQDVSNTVLFLLSPLSRATTGATIAVDGGLAVSFAR